MTQQLEVAADQPWTNLQNHPNLHKLLKVLEGLQRWQFHIHRKIVMRLADLKYLQLQLAATEVRDRQVAATEVAVCETRYSDL